MEREKLKRQPPSSPLATIPLWPILYGGGKRVTRLREAFKRLDSLQREFAELAKQETDPTNREILSSLFNGPAISGAEAGINSFAGAV